ncbi:polysaccharide pyruvyl transferase family protein [Microbacterium sp. NPDC057944]|uniref:polysaccharide pyruvyl transferase family protein n=1 Tax=Microbacterium sp. NPDC057944 TaxID=3346286 RepID=UPI0036DDE9D7
MTLALHWWRPLGNPRTAAGELLRHGSAWAHAVRMGGVPLNFGDEASRVALGELSGRPIRRSEIGSADVLGVGSILNRAWKAQPDATVFGSGLREPDHRPLPMAADRILAVRGTLTRDALGLPSTQTLGDPALIVGDVYGGGPAIRKSAPLFIPHFTMLAERASRAHLSGIRARGWDVQLPTTTPLAVAEAIRSAPVVATNSLHGVVFAHALGTPVVAVDVAGHAEPDFKYDDYLSVFGLRHRPTDVTVVADLSSAALIDQVAAQTEIVRAALPALVTSLHRAAAPLRSTS